MDGGGNDQVQQSSTRHLITRVCVWLLSVCEYLHNQLLLMKAGLREGTTKTQAKAPPFSLTICMYEIKC